MPDWDAASYHRLSGPQVDWGRKVLERLDAEPGDRILDIGCGTGRLTTEIAARPGMFVAGVDLSASMLEQAMEDARHARARAEAGHHAEPVTKNTPAASGLSRTSHVEYVRADGTALPFADAAFDAVFSAATFHWIPDHAALYESVHRVLKPGGRLVAQCGGGPNLQRLLERTHRLMDRAPYAQHFAGWYDPWFFAGVDDTRVRLERTGFTSVAVWLEEAPTTLENASAFASFISCVCVRHHVDKLPPAARTEFVGELTQLAAADDPPFTLDYLRLNITARKERR